MSSETQLVESGGAASASDYELDNGEMEALVQFEKRKQGVEEQEQKPRESLVEYDNPEQMTAAERRERDLLRKKGIAGISVTGEASSSSKKMTQLRDILDAILPPREFELPSASSAITNANVPPPAPNIGIQRVAMRPSSRDHVIQLQMKLDERLQQRQARENGICPVREELYSQCFDELIRQVCIESAERGLLLVRVRDEVRMTIAAYATLYESSITFGMRKSLQAEQGTGDLTARIAELEAEKKRLQGLVQDHKGMYEAIEKRIQEQKTQEDKKMQEEKDFLKFQAQHLESFLKSAMQ